VSLRGVVSGVLVVLVLVGLAAGAGIVRDWQRAMDSPLRIGDAGLRLNVRPGMGLGEIGRELTRQGVLDGPTYLIWTGLWRGLAGRLKAGEYQVPARTTLNGLLDLLVEGRVVLHSITLVEGWTFAQVREALARHEALTQSLDGVAAPDVMTRLERPDLHPEGWFLPETYRFPRGTADLEVLRRALHAMERLLAERWEQRAHDLPYTGPAEALVLASIVEKETARPEERPQVAGVLVRRLRLGMPLQVDPTVIYGLGQAFDGNLRRRDLEQDGPYNTYVRRGLPPTPIAMPGRDSLAAALNPQAGDALYFVARGDGSHQFSASLQAHQAAVRRYQQARPPSAVD
jgi:UPF0755 protein